MLSVVDGCVVGLILSLNSTDAEPDGNMTTTEQSNGTLTDTATVPMQTGTTTDMQTGTTLSTTKMMMEGTTEEV